MEDVPRRPHNKTILKPRRKQLRRNLTPAEAFLWSAIKNSQLAGRKSRRQHSVENYVLDFFCVTERLAVELDGEVHRNDVAEEYDLGRTLYLKSQGIKVIRFENFLVFQEFEYVLHRIQTNFEWWKPENNDSPPG